VKEKNGILSDYSSSDSSSAFLREDFSEIKMHKEKKEAEEAALNQSRRKKKKKEKKKKKKKSGKKERKEKKRKESNLSHSTKGAAASLTF